MPRRAVHKTKQNACGEVHITGLPAPGPGPGSAYSRLLDSSTTDYDPRPDGGPCALRPSPRARPPSGHSPPIGRSQIAADCRRSPRPTRPIHDSRIHDVTIPPADPGTVIPKIRKLKFLTKLSRLPPL